LRRRYATVAANSPQANVRHVTLRIQAIQGGERVRARRDSINLTAIKKTLRKRGVTFGRTTFSAMIYDARDPRATLVQQRPRAIFLHLARYLQNAAILRNALHKISPSAPFLRSSSRLVHDDEEGSTRAITRRLDPIDGTE